MTMETQVVVGADISRMKAQFAEAAREVAALGSRITGAFRGIRDAMGNIGNIMTAIGAVKLVGLADEAALLSARLKDVTGSASAAAQAQAQLFDIAQDLQVGYSDLTSSFARMMPAIKALGGGVNEASRLAEILATTARLSGASSAEAASSAVQFAQALGSGVLQGDELRSILENNQALARTLAGALGVSVGELKKMGAEGKLTSDIVANALLGQYDEIKSKAADLPQTVGGAWTRINNEFMRFVQSINEGTSVFSGITDLLNEVARFLAALTENFRTTGEEAKKLGADKSVSTWGRIIVETFAGIIDLASLVKQAFVSVGKDIGAVAAAIVQAVQGNFSTAYNILKQRSQDLATESQRMKDLWNGTGDSMLGALRRTPQSGKSGEDTPPGKLKGKPNPKEDKNKKAKSESEPSFMSYYEAALDQERRLETEKDALRELSKQQELAYWRQILQYAQLSTNDRLAITRKVADLEVDIRRTAAQDALALEREEASGRVQLALGAVEVRRAANKLALDEDRITKAQYVANELELEAQRYNIQASAIQERMRLAEKDPTTSPAERRRLNNELLALEQQFQVQRSATIGQLSQKNEQQQSAFFGGLANSFGQSLEYMLLKAKSWQDAMRVIWNGVAAVFIRTLITEPLGQWIASQAKMIAAKMGFLRASTAADTAASSTTMATKATEASAVIGAEGAKAGAGAAASQAGIPIVGPGLAIAAMFATLAAVLALRGQIKSAAGGYDIPSGVNPMVQLHEEEMVLPKSLANTVRDMAGGAGEGGAARGGSTSINVTAFDSRDVKSFFERNQRQFKQFMQGQRRTFAL